MSVMGHWQSFDQLIRRRDDFVAGQTKDPGAFQTDHQLRAGFRRTIDQREPDSR